MSRTGHSGYTSTVYLIHFERPYTSANGRKSVQHYIGSTNDLAARIAAHKGGRGARLMEVISAAGIPWHVDRTWPGGRTLERRLKQYHKSRQLCTTCREARIRARAEARWAAEAAQDDEVTRW